MKTNRRRSDSVLRLETYGAATRLWLPLAAILVVALLVPILLLVVMQWSGAALNVTTGASDLLGTMGGIMGAVFTVGGLVVTLVAILSQLQLEDRMQRVLSDAHEKIERDFQGKVVPSLQQQIQTQVDSFLAFFEATANVADWETAERLITEALQGYPKLRGARRFLGLHLAGLCMADFERQLVPKLLVAQQDPSLADNGGDFTLIASYVPGATSPWAMRAPGLPHNDSAPPQTALLRISAVRWLEEALAHSEDADGSVTSALALMYAYNQAFDKMLEAIRGALAVDGTKRQFLLAPSRLALLTSACENDEQHLVLLGEALRYTLPALPSTVTVNLNNDPWNHERTSNLLTWSMDWYAVERGWPGQSVSPIPSTIRIWGPGSDTVPVSRGGWSVQMLSPSGAPHPSVTAKRIPYNRETLPSAEALVEELRKQLLFLCPVASWSQYFADPE